MGQCIKGHPINIFGEGMAADDVRLTPKPKWTNSASKRVTPLVQDCPRCNGMVLRRSDADDEQVCLSCGWVALITPARAYKKQPSVRSRYAGEHQAMRDVIVTLIPTRGKPLYMAPLCPWCDAVMYKGPGIKKSRVYILPTPISIVS